MAPTQIRAPSLSHVRGCLLGGALGDALGYPIEFLSVQEIALRFGTSPPGALNYAGGDAAHISDDTQLTVFTAEGLIRAAQRLRLKGIVSAETVVAEAYLRWYRTQQGPYPPGAPTDGGLVSDRRLWARRAPGVTCLSALAALERDPSNLPTVARPPNDSKGCGAVMRVAPIGIAFAPDEAFELALSTSVLTHGHPGGYLSAAFFAATVSAILRGAAFEEALTTASRCLAPCRGRDDVLRALERVREAIDKRERPEPADYEALGGGWTGESALVLAIWTVASAGPPSSDEFRRAVWRAVNHSGDSDSVGSLVGNLLGALWGEDALQPGWLEALELRDVIGKVAGDLYRATVLGEEVGGRSIPLTEAQG